MNIHEVFKPVYITRIFLLIQTKLPYPRKLPGHSSAASEGMWTGTLECISTLATERTKGKT